MIKSLAYKLALAAAGLTAFTTVQPGAFAADDHVAAIRSEVVPQVRSWLEDPTVVSAIKSQNIQHAGLSQAEIENLDREWRSETSATNRKLIDSILSNQLSGFLSNVKKDARGVYTEIFVMDNKGLNVGQSDITSDYWQGDEDKWKKTYLAGPDAVFIDDVEFDESSQTFQSQLSLPIVDPDTGVTIGAVTVGVNVEMLQ